MQLKAGRVFWEESIITCGETTSPKSILTIGEERAYCLKIDMFEGSQKIHCVGKNENREGYRTERNIKIIYAE